MRKQRLKFYTGFMIGGAIVTAALHAFAAEPYSGTSDTATLHMSMNAISKAEAMEMLCRSGDPYGCAMIQAAAAANPSNPDEFLNRPLIYGDTPQKIYEYAAQHGIIFETEVME